jgi:hypothetical protein
MKEDYVNTVLRKDGTVVTITPTDGAYDLAVEDKHRTVGPEVAADPLHEPEFDAIVRELKEDLERRSEQPADQPRATH